MIGVLVLVLVAVAGLGMAYAWTRTQYFVGADRDKVAIFQGLSESIPGLSLSRVYEVQQLTVGELPPFYQEQVKAKIDVPSLDSARATVLSWAKRQACAPQPTTSARPTLHQVRKPARRRARSRRQATPQPSAPATTRRSRTADACGFTRYRCSPQAARVELALIIFALALTLGAYALVDFNVTGELSSSFPT